MEVIRIPQVSLVDSTGRRIGVYTDDPDWWQQLKLKHQNQGAINNTRVPAIQNKKDNQSVMNRQVTHLNLNEFGSKSKLIKSDEDTIKSQEDLKVISVSDDLPTNSTVSNHLPSPEEKECNVIGETPLHIAIMYDDLATLKFLIEEKGFDVNQRNSSGKFSGGFNSKLTAKLISQSKYESLAYYGEYPLAFAACFANKEIYDYLIEKGADPNLQDTNGNTVLHVLVINNKPDMFQYASSHPKTKASPIIKNKQGLSPNNLAAKLGRKDLFEKMLELRNIEIWRYSNITCSTYPLEGLDTIDSDGKIAWNAALSFIVNGDTDDHLEMLEIGVIKRLLEDKWSTYAMNALLKKAIISGFHLLFLTIAVYTRANDADHLDIWPPKTANTYFRYLSELAVIILCLAQLIIIALEIYGQGLKFYVTNLISEPANVLYLLFDFLILMAIPFRFVHFSESSKVTPRNVEDTFVILAIPLGWSHLLFYFRVISVTGPFVVMIYEMIAGDILTFASIYIVLLLGFSQGFYYLYKNAATSVTTMDSYWEAFLLSFQMTLGEFKARLPEFDKMYYSEFTKIVFIIFMILMHILLINMLIAMMGNTYHQIIKKSEKQYRKQWAHIVLLVERSFTPQQLQKFQSKYCINLPNKDGKKEVGLMVIKKVSKTKASTKIACIRNWKRLYKDTLKELKKHNNNSQQLLYAWENKDVKQVKTKKKHKDFDWSNYDPKNIKHLENKTNKPEIKTLKITNSINSTMNKNNQSSVEENLKQNSQNKIQETNSKTVISKDEAENTKNVLAKKPPIDQNRASIISTSGVKPITAQEPNAVKTKEVKRTDTVTSKGKSTENLQEATNSNEDSNSNSRSNSGGLQNLEIIHNETAPFTLMSRHMGRKTFYPNPINKIYPMRSTSFSSENIEKLKASNNNSPVPDLSQQTDLDNLKRPVSSTLKANGSIYIKQETYPKFPQQQKSQLTSQDSSQSNKTTEENISLNSSEIRFKQRTSPDGIESIKSKDNEQNADKV